MKSKNEINKEIFETLAKSWTWNEKMNEDNTYSTINNVLDSMIDEEPKKRKKKSSMGPTRAVIDVKQNGYMVVVGGKEYVFNNFEDMSEWLKKHMSPKLDSSDFIDAL